jgi:hypothetical protein
LPSRAHLTEAPVTYHTDRRAPSSLLCLPLRRRAAAAAILLAFAVCPLTVRAGAAPKRARKVKPRYYVQPRNVTLQLSASCAPVEKLGRDVLVKRLNNSALVVTSLKDAPTAPKDLAKLLKSRGLEGYALDLRITACSHELLPPRPGSAYQVLSVALSAALDAEKLPSGQIARAGEGTAQIGTEVRRIERAELEKLRVEALEAAVGQAVDAFIRSLGKSKRRRAQKRPGKHKRR